MIDNSFWNGKTVIVTGHTGFKGSWLACVLKSLNVNVIGISDFKRLSDNYKNLNTKEVFEREEEIDIFNDYDKLETLRFDNVDFVFHFAAQGIVSIANEKPLETINSNVIGTYNILNFVNNIHSVKTLIVATTDKVYLDTDGDNTEESRLGGKEFYSASKASSEHIISAFSNTMKREDLNIGIIRSGNVLGGGDGAKDRIITDLINCLKDNKDIFLRNPNSIRPWQYILDSLNGYLLTAQYCTKNKKDEVFNLNSELNNTYNVLDLTNEILDSWGSEINSQIIIENGDFYETDVLRINSKKANKVLNWDAIYSISDIAKSIVEWYKLSEFDKNITFKLIDDYYKNLNS